MGDGKRALPKSFDVEALLPRVPNYLERIYRRKNAPEHGIMSFLF